MWTWKEIKELIEKQGVSDDDQIAWIDITGFDDIEAVKDLDGEWQIKAK